MNINGTLVTMKQSTLNSLKEQLQQLSIEFQMLWSWRIKFQNNTFHLISTITLYQMMMKQLLTINKCHELVLLKSVTRECSSFQSSKEVTGQTVSLLLKNVYLYSKMRIKVKIVLNILQETAQWKLEDMECHQQKNKEEEDKVKPQSKVVSQDHNPINLLHLLLNLLKMKH